VAEFTEEGRRILSEIAGRYGVSVDAVEHLLMAVIAGQTTQAQFNHPDLGGMGQWSQGGMIMVGDMFNNALKAKVDGLCNELSGLARSANLFRPAASLQSQSQSQGGGAGVSLFVPGTFASGNWWPEDLGYAASTGAQNDLRYAFFPATHRLAINIGGRVTVYDTRDHQIGGFSQQQSGDQSLTFTSQYGLVNLSSLDIVSPAGARELAAPATSRSEFTAPETSAAPETARSPIPDTVQQAAASVPAAGRSTDDDVFGKIERLAELYAKGILTEDEFQAKKADLLSRL